MVDENWPRGPRRPWIFGATVGAALIVAACGRSDRPMGADPSRTGGTAGSGATSGSAGKGGTTGGVGGGGAGQGSGGTSGEAGTGEGGSAGEATCAVLPAGLVRLSLLQVKASLAALFGSDAADAITLPLELEDAEHQTVPALISPREGNAIGETLFASLDGIAEAAGRYVFDNLDAVTECGADPTEDCARTFLVDFAARAFRRPLSDGERSHVVELYDLQRASPIGASVAEAIQYGVYAVLESPHFVYRTELGELGNASERVALTAHELAAEVAYFLTGAPPDAELIDAATSGALDSDEGLAVHVDRLLASDESRARLAATAFAYFGLQNIEVTVLDGTIFPAWSLSLQSSATVEARTFLQRTWFGAPLGTLVTSRTAWINQELATLYGVAFPPSGQAPDANGFAEVELGPERAGLLTMVGSLSPLSYPQSASPIRRSLWVNSMLLCGEGPVFPDDVTELIAAKEAASLLLQGATEREKADYRANDALCASCHAPFDAFGVALESFDAIGAYRTVDTEGRAIDPSVTLPRSLGGGSAANTAAVGAALGESEAFTACLARTFLVDALTEFRPVEATGCEVEDVVTAFRASSDPSFRGLIRAIALSRALRERTKVNAP